MSEHAKPLASDPLEAILLNQSAMMILMEKQLKEQQKINLLLASLIQSMADEDEIAERPLRTYLNGEPIL
ncbi:hypothetical protein [Pseudomonas nitroreducens]|uniref:Uncharacterized protein n=1 Tax=Pseudomonas nitroreducens TaxID=46680 RepID=A0A6G6IUV1_PSENT|nr:hypothetical protein [Pseudomonas nitroreducens]QIE86782.1 hypothetical protein G5B91_11070 [Pseudomonas nitroreducens]